MKQGTNFLMDVEVDYDLNEVASIDFVFVQNEVRKVFHYPSSSATRLTDTNTVQLSWTVEDTFLFTTKQYLKMDSRITLTDSTYNPTTTITQIRLSPTLFKESELIS